MYFKEGLKPLAISKQLKLNVDVVYRVIQRAKNEIKRKSISTHSNVRERTPPDEFMELMTSAIREIGYENLKVDGLRNHLLKEIESNRKLRHIHVPSKSKILSLLKESFKLRFGHFNNALIKYHDPTFNEKRLWVTRLLVQFLFEQFMVISIDESNFRWDQLTKRQWQFDHRVISDVCKRMRGDQITETTFQLE